MSKKVLNHPDLNELIERLTSGESANLISDWLTKKYPDCPEYQITNNTLADFRKDYLHIDRTAARLLKREQKKKDMGLPYTTDVNELIKNNQRPKKKERGLPEPIKVQNSLLKQPSYQEKLKEIMDTQLDAPRMLKEVLTLVQSRVEVYYNELATASSVADTLRADRMFLEYLRLATDVFKDWKKFNDEWNKVPDEGNVDLNVVHEQVGMLRDAIMDVLQKQNPEFVLEVVDAINKRVAALEYKPQQVPDLMTRVEQMTEHIKEIQSQAGENE